MAKFLPWPRVLRFFPLSIPQNKPTYVFPSSSCSIIHVCVAAISESDALLISVAHNAPENNSASASSVRPAPDTDMPIFN